MHDGTIRWNQYALIAYLSNQLNGISPQFGKTVLQKMIYILQEVYHIPLGYKYTLYSYGPYCSELPKDLDIVEHLCGVDVCQIASGFGGVAIVPGEECEQVIDKGIKFIEQYKNEIKQAVHKFGQFTARELELRSTVLYCCSNMMKTSGALSFNDLFSTVSDVKPKFSGKEIKEAIQFLVNENQCPVNID